MVSKPEHFIYRFAPSPTGYLHVGGVRTALFNYFLAKQNSGKLILRIEDTDKERSKKEYEDDIIEGFKWLGVGFDETIRQSDRLDAHKKNLSALIEKDLAYISKEKAEENKRGEVIRFRNPNKKISFNDLIKGQIEFDTSELGDFVIAKSLEEPLFHLAVVIDDFEMGVTHVIRGEDHISNTSRQILIQEAIGAKRPEYAHIPLIFAKDRSKLSKRKHGESVSLKYYRDKGYMPEALINYLSLLGWNPGTDQEIFTADELIKSFSLERIQKGGAIFDIEKLNWVNKIYLEKLPSDILNDQIASVIKESGKFSDLSNNGVRYFAEVLSERIHYFGQITEFLEKGEFDYISQIPKYSPEALVWKKEGDLAQAKEHISAVLEFISKIAENPSPADVKSLILPYAEKEGKGNVLWPTRFALSGMEKSADPFSLISILGRKESSERLREALDLIV